MLKALIIDDEPRASHIMQMMIERYVPDIKRTWVCNDARQAAAIICETQPDLVFLDIQMPHFDGFEVLQQIRCRRFKVVFTTAFSEYALRAIRFSAFDYLLKPVDPEELIAAVQRYRASLDELPFQPEQLHNALNNLRTKNPDEFRLAVPSKDGIYFFMPAEIIRLEALGSYTQIHLSSGRHYLASKGLGEYDELLSPQGFIRSHKSHLVNCSHIVFLDHQGFLVMSDQSRVDLSRRKKEEAMRAMRAG